MLRRIPAMLGKVADDTKRVLTTAQVDRKGNAAKRRLSYRVLGGIHTIALYELDEPKALDDLAVKMKEHWRKVTEVAAG